MKEQGRLIILEGGDGVGKSTQTRALISELRLAGIDAIPTHEPGGTPQGTRMREIILEGEWQLTAEQELLAFTFQRDILIVSFIIPAILAGKTIVSDRSAISTFVYQYLKGCTRERILEVSRMVLELLRPIPKEVFILDIPADVARLRALEGKPDERQVNHFDEVGISEYARRRALYHEAPALLGWEATIVDGMGTVEEVTARLVQLLGIEQVVGAP